MTTPHFKVETEMLTFMDVAATACDFWFDTGSSLLSLLVLKIFDIKKTN